MQLWAMRYQENSINSKGTSSVNIIYSQVPYIKFKTAKKRSRIVILKQENLKAGTMEGSCLGVNYYTNHNTRSATATVRITEISNDSNMRLCQEPYELKCEHKRTLSSISLRRFWSTSPSILRAHASILWLLLLYTIIVPVHNYQGGVRGHEVRERKQLEQRSAVFKSHFITHDRAKRAAPTQYSALLSTDGHAEENDGFRPIIPKDIGPEFIAQSVFTKTGQYRVFQTPTSDLRHAVTAGAKKIDPITSIAEDNSEIDNGTEEEEEQMTEHNITTTVTTQESDETTVSLKDSNSNVKSTSARRQQSIEKSKNVTNTPSISANEIELKSNKTNSNKVSPNSMKSTQQRLNEGRRKVQKGSNRANETKKPTTAAEVQISSAPLAANISDNVVSNDIQELEALLVEYAESFFNQAQYEPTHQLINALQKNHTMNTTNLNDGDNDADENGLPSTAGGPYKKRPTRHASPQPQPHAHPHYHHHHHHPQMFHHQELHHHHHHQHLYHALPMQAAAIERKADGDISLNIPRAMDSGRLFFSAGLKKMLWPIFMGLQVLKSLLFALFLPTLIGSFGKLLGKGIVSGSAPIFIRPADMPQDLDFRDNTINFDDDKFAIVDEGTKGDGYAYNQAEAASQTHYTYNTAGGINRIEQQNKMPDTYLNALQTIGSASFKNSGSLSGSSSGGLGGGGGLGAPLRTKPAAPANTNNFQTFQKVPASSLLLSNYDPFYSPLLSRLDSVFAALKLNSDNENCREKLICLMYANPAKYAPYSNLVSAQLSRELNELRKPTSDNPDILRFFKYMRAAKDGQDGVDCEKSFDLCKEFKDFENPAMVSTYHDINKLVQARKLA